MHSPVKNHFHPRGNVYGIKPPKYPWLTEVLVWVVIIAAFAAAWRCL